MVRQPNLFHFGEVEDFLEEEYSPVFKRSRFASATINQGSFANNGFQVHAPVYNLLNEPSPLGLKLRKSPSLLDLIQTTLSEGSKASENKKESKGKAASTESEKVKASNFPALSLKIGTWEYVSKYEGDLVAKCYFAKRKLVWEVLEDHLKSKIEIPWADIAAMKADFPETGPGILTVVMSRQPAFFRETNPQPRKHTLWQPTSDFTDGEASKNRVHYVQCSKGVMNRHFEKLTLCDPRLGALSKLPIDMESPLFESLASVMEILDDSKSDGCTLVSSADRSSHCSMFDDVVSSASSFTTSGPTPSPSSVIDIVDEEVAKGHKGFIAQGINPSGSMTDLVRDCGHRIMEQGTSVSILSEKIALEGINQTLLSDHEPTGVLDEQILMRKVLSLNCLIRGSGETSNAQVDGSSGQNITYDLINNPFHQNDNMMRFIEQPPTFPRNDSVGDLLSNMPRIASYPQFLWGNDGDDQFHPFN